jgi:hypothetical protein
MEKIKEKMEKMEKMEDGQHAGRNRRRACFRIYITPEVYLEEKERSEYLRRW